MMSLYKYHKSTLKAIPKTYKCYGCNFENNELGCFNFLRFNKLGECDESNLIFVITEEEPEEPQTFEPIPKEEKYEQQSLFN